MRVDDDVIQREAVISPLKFDTIDGRARKAPRLGMSEHREEVVGADLALEAGAAWTRRSWARTAQTFLANFIDGPYYEEG
jgi:hypothetical protein